VATTWQQALSKAAATKSWAVGRCDQFVAEMWGQSGSGYGTAVENWNASPDKHQGAASDGTAPAGALVYWGGGDGHVALSAGDGTVWSTDIGGEGTVTRVPWTEISEKWGKPYLGWAPAFFNGKAPGAPGAFTPGAGGTSVLGGVADAAGLLSFPAEITGFFTKGTDDLADIGSFFSAFTRTSTWIRIGAGAGGTLLVTAGLVMLLLASRDAE
jgi:hypothetical protein